MARTCAHSGHRRGPGRNLVELFNGVDRLFAATLTELEAVGLSRRGTKHSAGQVAGVGRRRTPRVKALGLEWPKTIPTFPKRLYEIYDPPLVLYVRGCMMSLINMGLQ